MFVSGFGKRGFYERETGQYIAIEPILEILIVLLLID